MSTRVGSTGRALPKGITPAGTGNAGQTQEVVWSILGNTYWLKAEYILLHGFRAHAEAWRLVRIQEIRLAATMAMAAVVNHLIGEVAPPSRISATQCSFEKRANQNRTPIAIHQASFSAPRPYRHIQRRRRCNVKSHRTLAWTLFCACIAATRISVPVPSGFSSCDPRCS
jgi:hypothetical protein